MQQLDFNADKPGMLDLEQEELMRQLQGQQKTAAPPLSPPGGTAAPMGMAAPDEPVKQQQQPFGLGAYAGKLEGFDSGKLNSDHNSPKYAFGRAMSQFDPKGGITQEMLDALNGLGMGQVSGKLGGDKISVGGNVDPRFEGVTEFDIIRDLENGGGWQWGGLNGKAAAPGPQMGAGGMSQLMPTDMGTHNTLQAKIAELLGGPEAFSQEELMRQLGIM